MRFRQFIREAKDEEAHLEALKACKDDLKKVLKQYGAHLVGTRFGVLIAKGEGNRRIRL